MDDIAGRLLEPVVAQTFEPVSCRNMIVEAQMDGQRYSEILLQARLIVAHAGIGTIMAAREEGIPLIIVPRQADLGEHRNDHQLGTARQMIGHEGITVVSRLDRLEGLVKQTFDPPEAFNAPALDGLVNGVRSFIG